MALSSRPKVNADDLDLVATYLSEVPSRLLTHEEEILLAQRVERGDQAARNEFITHNLKLTVSSARRFLGRGVEFADLIAEGNLGLIRAVEKFDWRKGYKFSTYATWWILQGIHLAVYNHGRTIRVPARQSDLAGHLDIARKKLTGQLQREPTFLSGTAPLVADRFAAVAKAVLHGLNRWVEPYLAISVQDPADDRQAGGRGAFPQVRSN